MEKENNFVANLEELYERSKIANRTDFAKFLGSNYRTYCTWRDGTKPLPFVELAIEAYLSLSAQALKKLVSARLNEMIRQKSR